MNTKHWFVRGFELSNTIRIVRCYCAASNWQLYETNADTYAIAVLPSLYEYWVEMGLLDKNTFNTYSVRGEILHVFFDQNNGLISSVEKGPFPKDVLSARAFALTLKAMRQRLPNVSFGKALYIERFSVLLPDNSSETSLDDKVVLGHWLTEGVNISADNSSRLTALLGWMSQDQVEKILSDAGINIAHESDSAVDAQETVLKTVLQRTEPFSLPGRPALEEFFNENIVDIVKNSEKYARMGIGFPAAAILYGPPGSGKTYAIDRLIEYLGWPVYRIDSGSIGSPYIHDTSKKISELFDKAIKNAPSVVVIDEMEAFLSERNTSGNTALHHIEEVAEFLRRIPEAAEKNVLVFGMTNLIDSIDPAILRKGRFDHIIEVGMPSQEEAKNILLSLLKNIPVADDIDYEILSKELAGHPASDVAFVVKQAGRMAIKQEVDCINHDLLAMAVSTLPKIKQKEHRRIGF